MFFLNGFLKSNVKIKTVPPLESPQSGLSKGANVLILILHFDALNGGEPNFLHLIGRT